MGAVSTQTLILKFKLRVQLEGEDTEWNSKWHSTNLKEHKGQHNQLEKRHVAKPDYRYKSIWQKEVSSGSHTEVKIWIFGIATQRHARQIKLLHEKN